MDQKLCLYVCQIYLPEIKHILNTGDYPDVRVMSYPSDCMSSPLSPEKYARLSEKCLAEGGDVIIIGSSCVRDTTPEIQRNRKLRIEHLEYCSELIFSKELIEHFILKRYYLVSSGWLVNVKSHIRQWGFDPVTAKKFFAESADKILLLDTGIPVDYQVHLDALSEYMGLPYEILPIGLSHCQRLIDTLVFNWRENRERNKLNDQISLVSRKAADYSMIFEQMQRLVDLTDEGDIVQELFQLLNLLFAPGNITYDAFSQMGEESKWYFKPEFSDSTDSAATFLSIEARNQGEILGVFHLTGLSFPEYVEQYKSMRRVIGSLGGLAIANARKFSIIQQDEIQLRNFTEELQAANANKDRFFSIIAHDLRSPFSAFLGLTEIMTDETDQLTISEMRDTALIVNDRAKTLFSQLENLLVWSKLQMNGVSMDPVLLDLRDVVQCEIELAQTSAQKKHINVVNAVPDLMDVRTDRNMLSTIVRNLLANALKFSHPGGMITISARKSEKGMVEVRVQDSGIGMTPEMIKDLFSLHLQTNRKGTAGEPSTGLGLLLCKDFVEKIGGEIRVESEEGKGSVFYFTLKNS